jgi:hypothetical protein
MNLTFRFFIRTLALVMATAVTALSQTAVQFEIPITLKAGTKEIILSVGVSGDGVNPPGTILQQPTVLIASYSSHRVHHHRLILMHALSLFPIVQVHFR